MLPNQAVKRLPTMGAATGGSVSRIHDISIDLGPPTVDGDAALQDALTKIVALKAQLQLQNEAACSAKYLIENDWGRAGVSSLF